MDFDFEEMNQNRLIKNCEFLLMKIKLKNKKTWRELKEEFMDADEDDELQGVHRKIVETYNSLS